jgi:hypothetical protein
MRVVYLLGTLALMTSFAVTAAISPLAFQPQQASGSVASRVSTVRFSNLGFANYSHVATYAASFCDKSADLVTVNADMAVVRVTNRPNPSMCPLVLMDMNKKQRVFSGGNVEFTIAPWSNPHAMAFDVSPSFYLASRAAPTRVRVVGLDLTGVTHVTGSKGEGDCVDIVNIDRGFSCRLPVIDAHRIDPNTAIEFIVISSNGETRFTVQAIEDEPATIKSVSPDTLHSGSRFTVTFSEPINTATQLPWSPVLIHTATGKVEDSAAFTGLVWDASHQSLEATVHCLSCLPGPHIMHLGESLREMAGSIIPSSVAVVISEPKCTFTGTLQPSTISYEDVKAFQAYLVLPLVLQAAPRATYQVTVGDDSIPLTATFSGGAQGDTGILTLTSFSHIKSGRHYVTVYTVNDASRVITKCTLKDPLTITEPLAETAPLVSKASSRYIFTRDANATRTTLTFKGVRLGGVAAVRPEFPYHPIEDAHSCDIVSVTDTDVVCIVRNNNIHLSDVFDWVFFDANGAECARSRGHFALPVPMATDYAPNTLTMGTAQRVQVTMNSAVKMVMPVELVLVDSTGAVLSSAAQWGNGNVAVFADADFTAAGTAQIALRGRFPGMKDEIGTVSIPKAVLTVIKGRDPVPAIAAIFPSFLQISNTYPGKPTVVQIDIAHYPLVADRIAEVTIDGKSADILRSSDSSLFVSAIFKPFAANLTVSVLDKSGERVVADSFITVQPDLVDEKTGEKFYVLPGNNYAVPYGNDGMYTVIADLANVNGQKVTVGTDTGSVFRWVKEYHGLFTRCYITLTSCEDCIGRRVVITFTVGSETVYKAPFINTAFLVVKRPTVTRVWPATKLDFSFNSDCVPYAITVNEVNPRHPLALSFPDNLGVKIVTFGVDAATSAYTGCLICDGCTYGTFVAALVAPFSGGAIANMAMPNYKFEIMPSKRAAVTFTDSESGAAATTAPAYSSAPGKNTTGLSGVEITIIAAAGAIVLAAAAAVLAWRHSGARKGSVELSTDLLTTETGSAAV